MLGNVRVAVPAVYPDLSPTEMTVPVDTINRYIGTQLPGQQVADSLARMALSGSLSDDGAQVHVRVPPTRCDVLHACDVIEVGLVLLPVPACWPSQICERHHTGRSSVQQ